MHGPEHSAEPVEEVDYRCEWCATAIYVGDEAYNLAAFRMDVGQRTGNLCIEEEYFDDGGHEILVHKWCFRAAINASLLEHAAKLNGCCAWCNNAFSFGNRVVVLSPHKVQVSKRHGGAFLAPFVFPHGDIERMFHEDCFMTHAEGFAHRLWSAA